MSAMPFGGESAAADTATSGDKEGELRAPSVGHHDSTTGSTVDVPPRATFDEREVPDFVRAAATSRYEGCEEDLS